MGKSPGLKLQASIVQDNVPVEIAPRLFVGSLHAAFNVDALQALRITHVLNLAGSYATFPDEFTYLSISMRDKEYANLLSCVPVALLFVTAALETQDGGGILIHCAGGRSRSPAIAAAYLMVTQRVSLDEALARIRYVRPVVSLNAGFEAQLRCLEETQGDVFAAHQLVLRAGLLVAARQRQDGELLDGQLLMKKTSTRRSHDKHDHHDHHSSSHHHHHRRGLYSPRTPRGGGDGGDAVDGGDEGCQSQQHNTYAQFEKAATLACDERGMLHGRVPSGFSLSSSSSATSSPSCSKSAEFIPALRSMGSLFGCKACGENLFTASAIVMSSCQTTPSVEATTETTSQVHPKPTPTLSTTPATTPMTSTKRPLLAKLRLRPHSPGVSTKQRTKQQTTPGATGDGVASGDTCTTTSSSTTTPRAAVLKKIVPPTSPQQQQCREGTTVTTPSSPGEAIPSSSSSSSIASSSTKRHHGAKFWKSLASFASSSSAKRNLITGGRESDGTSGEKKKQAITSPKAVAIDLSADPDKSDGSVDKNNGDDVSRRKFLSDNRTRWETQLRQLSQSWVTTTTTTTTKSPSQLLSALVAHDAQLLAQLQASEKWLLEPQPWFITAATELVAPTGSIACPNDQCGVMLGTWHWDGMACDCGCGHVTLPAFAIQKSAIREMGSVVTPPHVQGGESRHHHHHHHHHHNHHHHSGANSILQ